MTVQPGFPAPKDVSTFFSPGSIAIIGASANLGKLGGRPVAALLKKGYAGAIYPVNPRYEKVAGLPCYPSIADVPGDVDLAIIAVPIGETLDALKQCCRKKVRAAVVFTAGFAEVGAEGRVLQQAISDLAARSGMRILGPNCLGLVSFHNGVMASFTDIAELDVDPAGSLGFVTQSGAYGEKTVLQAIQDGVGFSCFISVGNEADLQMADFFSYLSGDGHTRLMGAYLEGTKDGPLLRAAADKALRAGKPVLIKKVGRTRAGIRAAASHTGSLAGNDRIYDAFFRQTGIIRIEELRDLTCFALAFQSGRTPRGNAVAILTDSGGPGVELADKCEECGLTVPELTGATRAMIEAALPFYGSARNPIDMTAAVMTDQTLYGKCLRAIFADDRIHMVFAPGFFMAYVAPELLDEMLEIYRSSDKPLVMCPVWADSSPQARAMMDRVRQEGIPIIPEASDAARAMASLARYCQRREAILLSDRLNDERAVSLKGRETASSILQGSAAYTEYDAKKVLAAYGVPVTREGMATSEQEAVDLAERIGYPVVLKIQSPSIRHKTEVKGVMTGLHEEAEVRTAYRAVLANAAAFAPEAVVTGVLVQEYLSGGLEVIVGATKDPVFGPCIMFGLGGIFVEILKDVSFRIAPLSRRDAEEMLREVKGYALLEGVRGQPPSDIRSLVEVLLNVSLLIQDFGDRIEEIDINPLLVFPDGIRAVDALIVGRPA